MAGAAMPAIASKRRAPITGHHTSQVSGNREPLRPDVMPEIGA